MCLKKEPFVLERAASLTSGCVYRQQAVAIHQFLFNYFQLDCVARRALSIDTPQHSYYYYSCLSCSWTWCDWSL